MTDLDPSLPALLFSIRRSVRYHHRRQRFFDNVHHWKTALALLAGSATMVTLLPHVDTRLPLAFAALVTVLSTLDLVWGTTLKARLHTDLARRFLELERTITLTKDPTEADLRTWAAQRLLIKAEEPPVLRVLTLLCHNEVLLAMDGPRSELYDVPGFKRLLAPFMTLSDEAICKVGERTTEGVRR